MKMARDCSGFSILVFLFLIDEDCSVAGQVVWHDDSLRQCSSVAGVISDIKLGIEVNGVEQGTDRSAC